MAEIRIDVSGREDVVDIHFPDFGRVYITTSLAGDAIRIAFCSGKDQLRRDELHVEIHEEVIKAVIHPCDAKQQTIEGTYE